MPAEEVLDEGSIATPAGGATDEDIDALLASFSAARERAQAEEGARTVVMRVPEWLTQDTTHAGAERSNLVGALLESIDVPWTERTQSIYVRHLPARTIGFTYGAGSRGQAGTATPVPFVYVEFFTALQAREVMQRVEEGLRVQSGYDPHLGNALRVHVPPTSHRGAVDTKVRVAMAGEEPKVLDPLRDRDLVLDGNATVWRVHIPDPGFSLVNSELRVRFARLLAPLINRQLKDWGIGGSVSLVAIRAHTLEESGAHVAHGLIADVAIEGTPGVMPTVKGVNVQTERSCTHLISIIFRSKFIEKPSC